MKKQEEISFQASNIPGIKSPGIKFPGHQLSWASNCILFFWTIFWASNFWASNLQAFNLLGIYSPRHQISYWASNRKMKIAIWASN